MILANYLIYKNTHLIIKKLDLSKKTNRIYDINISVLNNLLRVIMAKKGRIEKNERVKATVNSQAQKRKSLKDQQRKIFNDYSTAIGKATDEAKQLQLMQEASSELFKLSVVFQKITRDGSKTRIRNRCAITGRPRGYHGLFGLSRNLIREAASFGLIMGLKKSSW